MCSFFFAVDCKIRSLFPVLPRWRAFNLARARPRCPFRITGQLGLSAGLSNATRGDKCHPRVVGHGSRVVYTTNANTDGKKAAALVKSDVHLCPLAASASASAVSARRKTVADSSIIRFYLRVSGSSSLRTGTRGSDPASASASGKKQRRSY